MVYNVAVVGIGKIGYGHEYALLREKPASHVDAYLAHPKVRLVGVADVNEARLEAFRVKHPEVGTYVSYKKLMEEEEPQIVSVCTPLKTHAQIFYDLVKYDFLKAVWMEKPLAHSLEAAKEMVNLSKQHGVKLIVNHSRRWSETYRQIKQVIDSKTFGELVKVVGFASRERDFKGNIHMFDMLNFLTGDNSNLWMYVDCYPVDYLIFELHIIFSDGKIKVLNNGGTVNMYRKEPSRQYTGINELTLIGNLPPYSFSKALTNAVKNIIYNLEGKEPLFCTGINGLKALEAWAAVFNE
jgi:predicted dehydrogenase